MNCAFGLSLLPFKPRFFQKPNHFFQFVYYLSLAKKYLSFTYNKKPGARKSNIILSKAIQSLYASAYYFVEKEAFMKITDQGIDLSYNFQAL